MWKTGAVGLSEKLEAGPTPPVIIAAIPPLPAFGAEVDMLAILPERDIWPL